MYGYARVSSRDQNLNRQLDALGAYGVGSANIYADHASGKDFDRPRYRELLHVLGDGDVLVVLSIDRLGRNYSEILEEWRRITKELGVAIVVLDMPLLDTRQGKRHAGCDQYPDCRYCAATAELRGAGGAREYPSAPGGGNCSGAGARGSFRSTSQAVPSSV